MNYGRRKYLGILLFLVALVGCTTVPETGRKALRFMPDSQLQSMAIEQFQQMKQEQRISKDPALNARIRQMGERIAKAAGQNGATWEFVVFDDDKTVNAFALPGGKVGVYTGLIKLSGSDDEIAAVMGHEVAHVILQHGNERVSQNLAAQMLGVGVQIGVRNKDEQTQQLAMLAYNVGTQVGVLLPYSREHEREADKIGLLYAAKAGYDPRAAVTFWQKMQQASGGQQPPQFLSTHPSHEDRIQRLQSFMPQAMQEYERARGTL